MAKRRKNWADPNFWTTSQYNLMSSDFFLQQLMALSMSRFRWEGLPPKVDVRYLEHTLMSQGVATLAWPDGFEPENAFAMQAVIKSGPDANHNYPKWEALGTNGLKWECRAHVNGVMVWDSPLRVPIMPNLRLCAGEMASILRTKQGVRQHMRHPVVMQGPREMRQQMQAAVAQIGDGEPYMIVYDGFRDVETKVLQVATGREAEELRELNSDLTNAWNMALRYLGIAAAPRKNERQTSEEIDQAGEPTEIQALGSLMVRRQACEALNALTGGSAQVFWNQDVESDAWEMLEDPITRAREGDPNADAGL